VSVVTVVPDRRTHSGLRCLYGAAAAVLRDDDDALDLLVDQALDDAGFGEALHAGVLSVAEQLRDVAGDRGMPGPTLLRILIRAHSELTSPGVSSADGNRSYAAGLTGLLLSAAEAYLEASGPLWSGDQLCDLAATPETALQCCARLLAAAVTWRARDLDAAPEVVLRSICLGLAVRDQS
jgi:hypothetical protein